jgi:N-acetylmuramoyl-L-alanine amidase
MVERPEARSAVWHGMGRRELLRLLAAAAVSTMPGAALAAVHKPRRRHVVVLDPGHGGLDPGAIGAGGSYEKEITLPLARALARELAVSDRYEVHLTRSDDAFVALSDRVAIARAHKADLFLSIHADALPDETMHGATVFTLSEKASDRQAALVAASENKADLIAGIDLSRNAPEVSDILFDLARRQTNNLSIRLARELVNELKRRVQLLNNSHRSAGFAVLKAPDVPSALVEVGCISNRQEERKLGEPSYRHSLAVGLARSVNDYFDNVVKA